MKTKRLISTISYNSEMFLASTFSRLVSGGQLDWAHWLKHQPENDETKEHYHVVLQPSRSLDTQLLQKEFFEPDLAHPGQMLSVMPFRFSKLSDWILYCLHDKTYLASKGMARDLHYQIEDMKSTCPDLLMEEFRTIDMRKYGVGELLNEAIKLGKSWESVIASGIIPAAQWRFWKEMFFAMGGHFINIKP